MTSRYDLIRAVGVTLTRDWYIGNLCREYSGSILHMRERLQRLG